MKIIFDLGGVVVRWEPAALLAQIFDDPATCQVLHTEFIGHADWLELDRGSMAPEDAVARAARRTGLSEQTVRHFLHKVPTSLVPIPETVALLYQLRDRGHSLYCLSNMHFASIEHLERTYDFFKVFDGAVISCRLQLCKPESGIYEHLLRTYALEAKDTVFIDDVQKNLDAAAQLGIRTLRFENAAQCERELRALGLL